MIRDKIVEEVRKAREELARKFNYDLDAMADDWQRRQTQSGARLVSLPKRPPTTPPEPPNNPERSEQS